MKFLKNIKSNVIVLGITSLFTDISSEMLYPVVPLFLTSVLGAPMSIVGLIEGVAESAASILKVFSGWLSDRIGRRRPIVIWGYSLSAIAKPIIFLAYTWPVVMAARFIDRVGKGVRTSPRDAILADDSERSYRGKAFGLHRAMDSLGACVGPLVAIWMLTAFKDNLRLVFLAAFIPALIAILTLIFFLKESKPKSSSGVKAPKIYLKNLSPEFKRFLLASSIFAVGNSSDAFLIVRAKDLGLSITMVVAAYVLYNISYSLLSTPFGALSDRIPRKTVMMAGYTVFAGVYLGFGLTGSANAVWALFPIYGIYIAMTDGVGKALASDIAGRENRATALGIYHFILGIFAFLASLVAGLLWAHIGPSAPFLYGAAAALLSCLAFAFLVK